LPVDQNRNPGAMLWGLVLVAIGVVFLLRNFNLLGSIRALMSASVFAFGGVACLILYRGERQRWWALVASFALFGLASRSLLGFVLPALGRHLGDLVFLGSLGLGFLLYFAVHREHWWPLLAGGTLVAVGLSHTVESLTRRSADFILLGGIGVSFLAVYVLHRSDRRASWTVVPGVILLLIAAAKLFWWGAWSKIVWPLALIGLGVLLLIRRTD
jgi:hypothetical protein